MQLHMQPPQPSLAEVVAPTDNQPKAAPADEAEEEEQRRLRRNVIASSIIGNVLEWYDFLVYAYQGVIIAKLFFPQSDTYTRYLSVYGIFAAGFITRPLGALFFGWIGDRYSRKTALLASIYTMSVPTFLMGCLPTYDQVGHLAPWLLVLTRIVQGFAVGGEFTATMVFLVEHAPPGQAGLQGSWAFFSVMVGVLVGSGVALLFNYTLSDEQLYSWGWRVPFMLSILGAGVGAYMRRNVHEPPSHHHHHHHHHQALDPQDSLHKPLDLDRHCSTSSMENGGNAAAAAEHTRLLPADGGGGSSSSAPAQDVHLRGGAAPPAHPPEPWPSSPAFETDHHRHPAQRSLASRLRSFARRPVPRAVLGSVTVFTIDFLTAVGFYLTVIFLPTFFQEFSGLSRRQATAVHTANMLLYMGLTPLGGLLSDCVGRLPLILGPGLLMAALAYPMWRLLSTPGSVMAALEGQGVLCIIMALFNGSLPATFTALFQPQYRCTGVAVGHNLSMALCGGTAPLLATALLKQSGVSAAPAFMLVAAGLLTVLGGLMARWLFNLR